MCHHQLCLVWVCVFEGGLEFCDNDREEMSLAGGHVSLREEEEESSKNRISLNL